MTPQAAESLLSSGVILAAWMALYSGRPVWFGAACPLLSIWSAVFLGNPLLALFLAAYWPPFFRECRREAARRDLHCDLRERLEGRCVVPHDEAAHLVSSFGGWSESAP